VNLLFGMSSSSARISISSDEVNLLIYRYLIEAGMSLCAFYCDSLAGFKHSAFAFHGESLLSRSPNLVQTDMPPGTLVTLLQKALLFLYVETHVANDGQTIQCDEAFSLLKPHDHDHGPLDAQIQFDESIADHVDVSGKRHGASVQDDNEKEESSSSKPPPMKKSKQVKTSKPSGETVEQTEIQDQVMADSETVPSIETLATEAEQGPDASAENNNIADPVSKQDEAEEEVKKPDEPQKDI